MPLPKRSKFISAALVVTLGLATVPVSAMAATSEELQAQLDQASQQLMSLYGEAEQAGYDLDNVTRDLNNTNDQITDLEGQISEQQAQLVTKKSQLCDILASQYKMGDETGLLSLILSSDSFGDLVSNIHYANKISEQKQGAIKEVRELQESLEQNKSSLEEQRTQQEQLVADQQAKAYYDQLSDEVKQKLAEEEAERRAAAEKEAQEAAAAAKKKAEEEAANNQNNASNSNNGGNSSNSSNSNSNNSNSGGSSNNNASKPNSGGGTPAPSGSASAMVSRALGVVGSGYRWSGYVWTGSTSSSAFTCSGLVDYALGLPTNSNSPESYFGSVRYITSDVSALNYGDLVFYTYAGRYPGHVGIYIGGGQIVDSCPGGGVQIRSVYYPGTFIGGGPIF